MLKNITIGQYFPGSSPLHRADPRIKIILTLVFMVVIFLINSFFGYLTLALFTLMSIFISGIPISYTLKGLKPILIIIIFAALINFFTVPGTAVVNFKVFGIYIRITQEGLIEGAKIAFRLILLITGASLLTLTTTPILLTDGMEKLMQPLKKIKVPAHEIAMMMTIALRFIPTLLEETDKIMKAQAARGADFDTGSLVARAKSFIPVLIPLFISAFRRADELATAMEARCYRGSEGRTKMKQLKLGIVDLQVSAALAVFTAAIIYLEYFL
jgi:energy-coupling factor transport system permease protein